MAMRKLWSISTNHIRPSTTDFLDEQAKVCANNPIMSALDIMRHDLGWLFLVSDPVWFDRTAKKHGVEELAGVMRAAFNKHAEAVSLDADGEVIDELEQFDWPEY